MRSKLTLVVALMMALTAVLAVAVAGEKAEKPAPAGTPEAAKAVETAPAEAAEKGDKKVAAVVGKETIYAEQLDKAIAFIKDRSEQKLTEEQLQQRRDMILNSMIERELIGAYLDTLEAKPGEVEAFKARIAEQLKDQGQDMTVEQMMAMQGITDEQLARQVKLDRVITEATSEKKVQDFIKDHPDSWFDGTTVTASHVLVTVKPYAPAAEKKAVKAKLQKLAERIRSGKVEFAEAAKAQSDCPSAAKGGDLGPFTFSSMVMPFAEKAFAMKPGEVSDVVQTRFGYHVIKVADRKEGSGEPNAMAADAAKRLLASRLEQEMIAKGQKVAPVTIPKDK